MECPICKGTMQGTMTAAQQGKSELHILKCVNCCFLGVDLDNWHYPYIDQDYYTNIDLKAIHPERPHIRHRVSQMCRFVSQGRAVDLGCGLGETAIALSRAGFEAHGVEESSNAITFLHDNFPDLHWHNAQILPFLEGQCDVFDIVSLFHVLEHVPRPRELCQRAVAALRNKGLLVIEVPDVSSGQARFRGQRWQHWLPHHVNYFSLATLKRLLVPLGLELVGMEVKYHLSFPQGIWWRDVMIT